MDSEKLLNDSRITPVGNGDIDRPINDAKPTNTHKWWAAILLGIIFFMLAIPYSYYLTNYISVMTGTNALATEHAGSPTVLGVLVHMVLFIVIVRIILW